MENEESQVTEPSWPDSVHTALKGLEKFDRICVTWIDASESTNVPVKDPKVPNHVVETAIKSEGKFFGIQIGPTFQDPHILVLKEITERQRGTVESIPLVLVRDVQVFDKVARKTNNRSDHKYVFHYNDGIVKRVRGFQNSIRRP